MSEKKWDDDNSKTFINFHDFFYPNKSKISNYIIEFLEDSASVKSNILDIGCGNGWLLESLLEKYPNLNGVGLDGSHNMLSLAQERLDRFNHRFELRSFTLESDDWRQGLSKYNIIISSLCIHHLIGEEKKKLYQSLFRGLEKNGQVLIYDLIMFCSNNQRKFWAKNYDDLVKKQSLQSHLSDKIFDRFSEEQWNYFSFPEDEADHPSTLMENLSWLKEVGFSDVDCYFLESGHALYGGYKRF